MRHKWTPRELLDYFDVHGHFPFRFAGGDGTGATPSPTPTSDPANSSSDDPALGDAGKKALDAEREARRKAESDAKQAKDQLETLMREKAETDAAKAAAEEEEARKRGEFEQIAQKRQGELETVKLELEALKADFAKASELLESVITERVAALEATESTDLIAAFPREATALEKIAWLDDPRTKAAVTRAEEAKKVLGANGKPKVPGTPDPSSGARSATDAEKARAVRKAARTYTG